MKFLKKFSNLSDITSYSEEYLKEALLNSNGLRPNVSVSTENLKKVSYFPKNFIYYSTTSSTIESLSAVPYNECSFTVTGGSTSAFTIVSNSTALTCTKATYHTLESGSEQNATISSDKLSVSFPEKGFFTADFDIAANGSTEKTRKMALTLAQPKKSYSINLTQDKGKVVPYVYFTDGDGDGTIMTGSTCGSEGDTIILEMSANTEWDIKIVENEYITVNPYYVNLGTAFLATGTTTVYSTSNWTATTTDNGNLRQSPHFAFKDSNGNEITSGSACPQGTKLTIFTNSATAILSVSSANPITWTFTNMANSATCDIEIEQGSINVDIKPSIVNSNITVTSDAHTGQSIDYILKQGSSTATTWELKHNAPNWFSLSSTAGTFTNGMATVWGTFSANSSEARTVTITMTVGAQTASTTTTQNGGQVIINLRNNTNSTGTTTTFSYATGTTNTELPSSFSSATVADNIVIPYGAYLWLKSESRLLANACIGLRKGSSTGKLIATMRYSDFYCYIAQASLQYYGNNTYYTSIETGITASSGLTAN